MKEFAYQILRIPEFRDWFNIQTEKSRVQIDGRLSRIQEIGYFGDLKQVGDDIWELRWTNGRRLYFAYIAQRKIILLLGGNKNGQDKDIRQAKNFFKKYTAHH